MPMKTVLKDALASLTGKSTKVDLLNVVRMNAPPPVQKALPPKFMLGICLGQSSGKI